MLSLQNNVNHKLLKIDEWLRINKLIVNLDKTNFLLFSNCSRPKSVELTYKLSRQVVAGNTVGENVSKRIRLSIVVKPSL